MLLLIFYNCILQEGKKLLGGRKLGDTRQVTKAKQNSSLKRATTMQNVVAEGNDGGLSF